MRTIPAGPGLLLIALIILLAIQLDASTYQATGMLP